jgi:peptide/nickel transport system substrate-binding protein
VVNAGLAILLSLNLPAAAAETPKRGGTLTYMIPPDAPPSFDGHREGTFATVHAVAPFYSVLVRVNPENPASTTDFVCDVCPRGWVRARSSMRLRRYRGSAFSDRDQSSCR